MFPLGFDTLPTYRQRAILKGQARALVRDLALYGQLHPTPQIEAQLAEWRARLELVQQALTSMVGR